MDQIHLYPLQFEPVYQYRLWGGRRLTEVLSLPLPDDGPFGEAWLLSDRDDQQSKVANGSLKNLTLGGLMKQYPDELMGNQANRFKRFPLLLKFLDAKELLSVQVHPSDEHKDLLPAGETGKTEAWVVLKTGKSSRIYAGLKPGTNSENLKLAVKNGKVADHLASFTPKEGDGIFIPAGTVHSFGGDTVLFEVQQNSDVTFRLYDWDHIDAKTGKPRPLQVEQALACINFAQGELSPVLPELEEIEPVVREKLFSCEHFDLWRLQGKSLFTVGVKDQPRVLVCIEGSGKLEYNETFYKISKGNVFILPAEVGICEFKPDEAVNLLEIAIPDGKNCNNKELYDI